MKCGTVDIKEWVTAFHLPSNQHCVICFILSSHYILNHFRIHHPTSIFSSSIKASGPLSLEAMHDSMDCYSHHINKTELNSAEAPLCFTHYRVCFGSCAVSSLHHSFF